MKKKPQPLTVKLVASLTALVGLASSIMTRQDAATCLLRGAVAWYVGKVLAGIWCSLFATLTVKKDEDQILDDETAETLEESEELAA